MHSVPPTPIPNAASPGTGGRVQLGQWKQIATEHKIVAE
jgi:hypothetical protein